MDVVTLSMAKAYTDSQRLAYTEGGKIMWDVELVPMEGTGFTYFQESNTDQTVLSVGKTYTVTTDSGSFTTVCKEMSGVVFLGNGSILGITGVEDSGENFLVAVDEDHVMGFCDFNGGSRMEISTAATIHPIDPKFLPGVCLPVVDLTGCAVGKEITDEAINATLTKLAATGMPIIGITYASGVGKVSEVFANAAFGVAFIGSTTKCQITNPSATGTNGWVLGASE